MDCYVDAHINMLWCIDCVLETSIGGSDNGVSLKQGDGKIMMVTVIFEQHPSAPLTLSSVVVLVIVLDTVCELFVHVAVLVLCVLLIKYLTVIKYN